MGLKFNSVSAFLQLNEFGDTPPRDTNESDDQQPENSEDREGEEVRFIISALNLLLLFSMSSCPKKCCLLWRFPPFASHITLYVSRVLSLSQ